MLHRAPRSEFKVSLVEILADLAAVALIAACGVSLAYVLLLPYITLDDRAILPAPKIGLRPHAIHYGPASTHAADARP